MQRRQLQPPHAGILQRRQETRLSLSPSRRRHRLDLHADRITLTVNQAAHGTGGWQRDFTVERQRPGLAVHRQHATTGADTGIVIADFNDIARYMASLSAPTLKSTVCVSSSSVLGTSRRPAVCLPPAGTAKGIHL